MPQKTFAGSLKPGIKLGKYEVREQIGTGGMAVIYKAYDPSLDRYVAIKQIAPHLAQDERFLERFRTEAQTLAKLSSSQANIVNVHELIQQDGQLYLVMEHVEGTTLRTLMDRGPVPLQTGLGILLSTALGLKAMHSQGIVHRDLTPANIMMAKDGALKITDFGLIGHSGGKTSLPMGTTKYMAPEMFTGVPVDPRADLYSLGVIAYEMFVGPDKFAEVFKDVLRDERAQQVRWMHWHSNPTLKVPSLRDLQPGVPPLVVKITERMMEKDPSKRFASAEQIIRWLRRIFVMHVQGKSISLKDSEAMEQEMEADAAGVTPPAVRPGGAAAVPGGQAGVPAPAESGEKTAPLPQPAWTWKRATFWAAIVLGPLIALSVGLLIWRSHVTGERIVLAMRMQMEGDELFKNGQFADADTLFTKMAMEYHDLDSYTLYAKQHAMMARAEGTLEKKEWEKADSAAIMAEQKYGASPIWATDFRKRYLRAQDIDQQLKIVELAQQKNDFTQAVALLGDLQAKYTDLQLNDRISELRQKIELGAYTASVEEGKEHLAKRNFDAAESAFLAAKKKRETPEVLELLQTVANERKYAQLLALAQKAESGGKWGDARTYYAQIMDLKPSEIIRRSRDNAAAEELAVQAETLEKNGLMKEAMDIWTKVIGLNPVHPKAVPALQRAGRQQQLDSYLKAGKDAMAKSEWDTAINSYKEALKLLDPKETDLKAQIDGQIVEASYRKFLEAARDALKQKNFDEAEQLATQAQACRDSDSVKTLLAQIDTHRQYYKHLDLAKALFSQASYVDALGAAQRAQKVMDTQEVRDLITEVQYARYFMQGKSYVQDKMLDQALSVFKIAQRYRDTAEVQGWIDLVQKAIAARRQSEKKE